jgi:hypothetical protein
VYLTRALSARPSALELTGNCPLSDQEARAFSRPYRTVVAAVVQTIERHKSLLYELRQCAARLPLHASSTGIDVGWDAGRKGDGRLSFVRHGITPFADE